MTATRARLGHFAASLQQGDYHLEEVVRQELRGGVGQSGGEPSRLRYQTAGHVPLYIITFSVSIYRPPARVWFPMTSWRIDTCCQSSLEGPVHS